MSKTINSTHNKAENGFTIVELMIATTVLSVILLLASVVIIGIGNLFYKGVAQSQTQGDVRTIIDDVSQHLKLDGGNVIAFTDPSNPDIVHAATSPSGLFRSTDGGGSWISIGAGLPANFAVNTIAVDPRDSNKIWAGLGAGLPGAFVGTGGQGEGSADGGISEQDSVAVEDRGAVVRREDRRSDSHRTGV